MVKDGTNTQRHPKNFPLPSALFFDCGRTLICRSVNLALKVVNTFLIPVLNVSYRATAFGALNAICKLAAILGSSIFASFVGITKVIPILLSFGALVGGGVVALKLPETREKILL